MHQRNTEYSVYTQARGSLFKRKLPKTGFMGSVEGSEMFSLAEYAAPTEANT